MFRYKLRIIQISYQQVSLKIKQLLRIRPTVVYPSRPPYCGWLWATQLRHLYRDTVLYPDLSTLGESEKTGGIVLQKSWWPFLVIAYCIFFSQYITVPNSYSSLYHFITKFLRHKKMFTSRIFLVGKFSNFGGCRPLTGLYKWLPKFHNLLPHKPCPKLYISSC